MINEEIEDDTEEFTPLTTALGIRCLDAVVLANDSQATSKIGKTKSLDSTKIIQINEFMGMTGSGDSYHIKLVADEAKERLGEKKLSPQELEKSLNKMMKDLHKQHNAIRSEELGYKEVKKMFHPQCLMGSVHSDDSLGLYMLRDDAWVEPVEGYQIVGSGIILVILLSVSKPGSSSQRIRKYQMLLSIMESFLLVILSTR